ncbi:MAG: hypothetical protein GSR73_05655 [Desulfurococcales archaeon]|nr:hypothetical protein [Desulfurococcales archaeon]
MTLASLSEAVESVRRERIRGARWSLYTIARAIIEELEKGNISCSNIGEASALVLSANRSMAPLANLAYVLEEACARGTSLAQVVRRVMQHQQRSIELIREFGHQLPADAKIATISYSSSVEAVLLASADRKPYVTVLESRPGGEGAVLASTLRDAGLRVRLLPDSMMYRAVEESDVVVVGADAVTRDACLVNKVGTRQVALLAGLYKKPVLAVFDLLKIHPETTCDTHPIEERSYMSPGYGPIRYPLFDKTEPSLISKAVTEKGIIDYEPNTLARLWRSVIDEIIAP